MAYINSLDLSDKEPKDIAHLYNKALSEIKEENKLIDKESRKSRSKIFFNFYCTSFQNVVDEIKENRK